MSTETTTAPKAAGETLALLKHLAGKDEKVPVSALPKNLTAPAVLASALAGGFVQVGQPGHCWADGESYQRQDERGKTYIERNPKCYVNGDWSWTDLRGPKRKTLRELLTEDAKNPEAIRLHLRLTDAGLAACA